MPTYPERVSRVAGKKLLEAYRGKYDSKAGLRINADLKGETS